MGNISVVGAPKPGGNRIIVLTGAARPFAPLYRNLYIFHGIIVGKIPFSIDPVAQPDRATAF